MYKILYKRYPNSKFILTLRKNPDVWFKSLCKHAIRTDTAEYRELVYGYPMPQDNMETYIDFYNSHNKAVRGFFKDKTF